MEQLKKLAQFGKKGLKWNEIRNGWTGAQNAQHTWMVCMCVCSCFTARFQFRSVSCVWTNGHQYMHAVSSSHFCTYTSLFLSFARKTLTNPCKCVSVCVRAFKTKILNVKTRVDLSFQLLEMESKWVCMCLCVKQCQSCFEYKYQRTRAHTHTHKGTLMCGKIGKSNREGKNKNLKRQALAFCLCRKSNTIIEE